MEEKENYNKLYVCTSPRCKKNGADELISILEKVLKTKLDESEKDDLIQLVSVSCLGRCATGPNVRTTEKIYTNINKETLKKLLSLMKSNILRKRDNIDPM